MNDITIMETDKPACADGCCHQHVLIIDINDEKIEFDMGDLLDLDYSDLSKRILSPVLEKLGVECKIHSYTF